MIRAGGGSLCLLGPITGENALPLPPPPHPLQARAQSLCASEERTRKARRKPGSAQRKNWGWATLSSDRQPQGRRKCRRGWSKEQWGPGRAQACCLHQLQHDRGAGTAGQEPVSAQPCCRVTCLPLGLAQGAWHMCALLLPVTSLCILGAAASLLLVSHREESNFWGLRASTGCDSGTDGL